jgi:PilZ domain
MIAVLRLPGRDAMKVRVNDLSPGGVSVACELKIEWGAEVSVELPDAGGSIIGNVRRSGEGVLGLEFRADEVTRAH